MKLKVKVKMRLGVKVKGELASGCGRSRLETKLKIFCEESNRVFLFV